jgi:hypothetical protein
MYLNSHVIQQLKIKTPQELKDKFPIYPTVRKTQDKDVFVFSTLVRKRYNKEYYLVPIDFKDKIEAKAIHGLHASVYKYLMLGEYEPALISLIKDDNQINEMERLTNII